MSNFIRNIFIYVNENNFDTYNKILENILEQLKTLNTIPSTSFLSDIKILLPALLGAIFGGFSTFFITNFFYKKNKLDLKNRIFAKHIESNYTLFLHINKLSKMEQITEKDYGDLIDFLANYVPFFLSDDFNVVIKEVINFTKKNAYDNSLDSKVINNKTNKLTKKCLEVIKNLNSYGGNIYD